MKTQISLCALLLGCFVCLQANAQPTTSATIPPARDPNKVISLYSDAYSSSLSVGYCESWGGVTTTLTKKAIGTDNYLYYQNFNYLGWQLYSPATVSVVSMTHLHVDIWSPTAGSIGIVPIYGGSGLPTDDTRRKIVTLTANTWNSFDLELSTDFSGLNLSSIHQVKFDRGTNVTSFAVDNFYFYNSNTDVDTEKPTALTASLVSTSYFSAVLACSATDNSGAVNFTILNGVDTVATGGAASGVATDITVSNLEAATAYTFTIKASDADGNVSDTTVFVSATTLTSPAAAPAPTVNAANVMSIYSDTYTAAAAFNIGYWGQNTIAKEVALATGNNAYILQNFNYLGLEINNNTPINISAMSTLHIDVWSADEVFVEITPIWGGECLVRNSLRKNEWNSYDIPLSSFTGINLVNVYQIKMVGGGNYGSNPKATIFFDNLYFYSDVTSLNESNSLNEMKVRSADGLLMIDGVENRPIAVYSISGKCMYTTDKAADKLQIALPVGMYMVKTADQTAKIMVR